jgi:hypothetical protein
MRINISFSLSLNLFPKIVFKKKTQLILDGVIERLVQRQKFFFLNTRNTCVFNWRKFY